MIIRLAVPMICGLTVAACAPSSCHTRCGFLAESVPKGWSCQDVQNVETASLKAFKNTKDPRLVLCNMRGYYLTVMPERTWWLQGNGWGEKVSGVTYCDDKQVIIGTDTPFESSLAHEFAHVLQGCDPLRPYDSKDYYHSNWERDGIYDAIEKAQEWDGGN